MQLPINLASIALVNSCQCDISIPTRMSSSKCEMKVRFTHKIISGHCGGCYTGKTTHHLSTRVAKHISGRPVPSEVSLHQHVATNENFKAVLRTTHIKIGEAVI